MENEKRLIDANALRLIFGEEAEKIELGVKDERKKVVSKLLIHWCMDKLADAPTVDAVEVVHGRWIFGTTLNHSWMKCSECLKSQTPNGCFTYCPNCGAKMDGGNEDESS